MLPHDLNDICPLLPEKASRGIVVSFIWPPRGDYVYSREVQLQVQVFDEGGSEVSFSELAVTLHV
jgi:hypothetical protein